MLEPIPTRAAAIVDTAEKFDFRGRHVLHRDYETRSRLSLKSVGTHRYATSLTPKFSAALTPSMMSRCSCGSRAIQCRRNSSKPQTIRTGLSPPMAIISSRRSSATSWRRASAGRKSRSSGTAAL